MYKNLKNKKILIFGNTGFIGSWLSIALDLFDVKVLGISLKMSNQNYVSNTSQFKKKIKTVYCDINNLDKINDWKHIIELIPDYYLKNKMEKTGIAGIFAASLELTKEGIVKVSQNRMFDKLMIKKT